MSLKYIYIKVFSQMLLPYSNSPSELLWSRPSLTWINMYFVKVMLGGTQSSTKTSSSQKLHLREAWGFFLFTLLNPGSTLGPPKPPLIYDKPKLSSVYNWSLLKIFAFLAHNCNFVFLILNSSWGLVADLVLCAMESLWRPSWNWE